MDSRRIVHYCIAVCSPREPHVVVVSETDIMAGRRGGRGRFRESVYIWSTGGRSECQQQWTLLLFPARQLPKREEGTKWRVMV